MATLRFIVSGRVQGVGFRYFVHRTAVRLGVHGWVRNLPDGNVECVAQGTPDQLTALERDLRTGPSLARVASVESQSHADLSTSAFEVRR